MPDFAETAHITMRGRNVPLPVQGQLPRLDGGELVTNAWLLFEAVRTQAMKDRVRTDQLPATEPMAWEGIDGWLWHGNVNAVAKPMWPRYSDPSAEADQVRRKINGHLRSSLNMVCLAHGNPGKPSQWWIRDGDFNDAAPANSVIEVHSKPSHKTVTDQEAGKDRPPAPVTTSWKCRSCDETFIKEKDRTRHSLRVHKTAREWIIEALGILAKPARAHEIYDAVAPRGFPGADGQTLWREARLMADEGLLTRVTIPGPGGEVPLYGLLPEPEPEPVAVTPAPAPEPVMAVPQPAGDNVLELLTPGEIMLLRGIRMMIAEKAADGDPALRAENRRLAALLARRTGE